MAGVEKASDRIPSVEDMMKDLEDEVVAEHSEDKGARAYVNDAKDLLEIAAELKERARKHDKDSPGRVIRENEHVSAKEEKAVQSD